MGNSVKSTSIISKREWIRFYGGNFADNILLSFRKWIFFKRIDFGSAMESKLYSFSEEYFSERSSYTKEQTWSYKKLYYL